MDRPALQVVLVWVGETATNAFSCLVRKAWSRRKVRCFSSLGTSCVADEMQVFEVPLAPGTDPQVKLEVDSLSQTKRSFH